MLLGIHVGIDPDWEEDKGVPVFAAGSADTVLVPPPAASTAVVNIEELVVVQLGAREEVDSSAKPAV